MLARLALIACALRVAARYRRGASARRQHLPDALVQRLTCHAPTTAAVP
ncbi:hypothetical protein [Dyella agri]|uniref:Uncharacterized protein n=1 Tax=Dyella agri TaxID=1926869 RepID=A0ABW8KHW9_9GAMM